MTMTDCLPFFQLCHLRGHICEGCRSDDILFPFQATDVSQCDVCKACYHKPCYDNAAGECTKCQRIEARRRAKAALAHQALMEDPEQEEQEEEEQR